MSDSDRTSGARALHALAASRRTRSQGSPATSDGDAMSDDASTFNPDNDDALMSTKHHIDEDDSHFLPKIRTTAQQRRFYNPLPPPNVASSAVRREFGDFDHSNSTDGEDDSIEVGRGIGHTPSKPNKSLDSEILLEIGNSQFEVYGTPQSRARPTPKSNLRKEAQLRRASSTRVNGHVKSTKENNAPALHDDHSRPTRSMNRTVSANNDTYQRPLAGTPQRVNGTPRGVANSTVQSFILPDLGNMTELYGASMLSGTGGLPRGGISNRRVVSAYGGRAPGNFIPVGGVPIPEEEKHILAALQLIKDRLDMVEQEKVDAEARVEEYELLVMDLQAKLEAQAALRRSDSALGSSDGEAPANGKNKWKIEKAQLEASTASMQRRLDQAERKVTTAEAATKRVTSERDSLATQLSVAYYNNEEMKGENEVLQNENRLLQDQVADLQTENRALTHEVEELRSQFDQSHERHEDETQRWQKKEAALNRKVNTNDRAILQENQTLRDDLIRARELQEDAERKAKRREEKARREAERAAEVERVKLMEEKEQLEVELAQAKEARQNELKRWSSKQAELQAHIDQREETIHQLRVSVPQDQINDDLRKENQDLKAELASLKAAARPQEQATPKEVLRKRLEEVTERHVEADERWARKEAKLQDRLNQVREVNDLYRQLESVRDEGKTSRSGAGAKTTRRSTGQIGTNITETMHTRNEHKSRSRSKSQSRRIPRTELPRSHRHVSAPATTAVDDAGELSDASTTDLSFDPAILAGAPHSGGKGKRATGFVPPQTHTGDTTYLSFVHGDEIAKLRKRIEEEHIAARQRKAAPPADEHVEVTGYGVRRRSSMKDVTGRSRASSRARSVLSMHADDEDDSAIEENLTRGTRKEDTLHSRASMRSRSRRRSSVGAKDGAFTEMTSAFIIPDITMHTRDATINKKDLHHDMRNCNVCQRIIAASPVEIDDLDILTPIPVTLRPEYKADIDATLRPSQPVPKALARVMKELSDELVHLKLQASILIKQQTSHDPALKQRQMGVLHGRIAKVNNAIKVKTGQLYSLHDVWVVHGEGGGEEVERTLEDVMSARGRKVGFESGSEDEGVEGSEWPGISDTEGM